MLTNELLYNSVALMHISKNKEMETELNGLLAKDNLSVNELLKMSANDFIKTNANEVMGTGQVGFGKEWVEEVVLSRELMTRIENSKSLLGKISLIQMINGTEDKPVQGIRLKMTRQAETTDIPPKKNTTQVKKAPTTTYRLEAKELVVTIYYSDTWLEDSVINVAEYVVGEIVSAYEHTIHNIVINGDVATTGNINVVGGTVANLEDGTADDTLNYNGARKIAITKGATVDAGNNLELSVIRKARATMGIKGLNPAELVMVIEQNAYFELLNLSEVQTMEKFGDAATVKNGVITAIDGIEIIPREELTLAQADGKINVDSELNVYGQIVLIHLPSLKVGIRRSLTTELSRYAEDRTTGITGSARIAVSFVDVQNNKEATSPVALITNVNSIVEESL